MSLKSSYIQLYGTDTKSNLLIDASSGVVKISSISELRFENDVSYKSNATTYTNIGAKFSSLDTYNTDFYQQWGDNLIVDRAKSLLEISDRKAGDALLTTNLNVEKTARELADTSFQTLMATETTERKSTDASLASNLTFETNRAIANEDILLLNINTEKAFTATERATETKARIDADTLESKTRADADTLESKTRLDADTLEAKTRADADTAEAKARLDGDASVNINIASLITRLDNLTVNLDSSKLDSLSEVVNRMNATGLDVYQRLSYLESIVGTLRNEALYAVAKPAYVTDVPASL